MKTSARSTLRELARSTFKRRATIGIAGVSASALLVGVGIQIGREGTAPGLPGPQLSAPEVRPAPNTGTPPEFLQFREQKAGFALSYPADWMRLQPTDPQVVLVAVKDPAYSFLVRESELPAPVGLPDLPAAKTLTDKAVLEDKSITVLSQQQIVLAGLPGYYYFYSFTDPASGQIGLHSHFFVFKGKTMISLVFQVIPSNRFGAAASTFDRITSSLQIM